MRIFKNIIPITDASYLDKITGSILDNARDLSVEWLRKHHYACAIYGRSAYFNNKEQRERIIKALQRHQMENCVVIKVDKKHLFDREPLLDVMGKQRIDENGARMWEEWKPKVMAYHVPLQEDALKEIDLAYFIDDILLTNESQDFAIVCSDVSHDFDTFGYNIIAGKRLFVEDAIGMSIEDSWFQYEQGPLQWARADYPNEIAHYERLMKRYRDFITV